ncbi:MAG: CARDB domain-containing protein [Candidatus Eremiobacterota bacterium]
MRLTVLLRLALLALFTSTALASDKEPSLEVVKFELTGNQARVTVQNKGYAPASGARCRITSQGQLLGVLEKRLTVTPGARVELEGTLNTEGASPETAAVPLRAVSNLPTGKLYSFQHGSMGGQVSVEELLRGRMGVDALEVPKEVHVGEKVETNVRVANLGAAPVGGATVILLDNGREVGRQRLLRRMGAGSKESLVFDWIPEQAGQSTLSVAFDPASPPMEGENPGQVAVKVEPARVPDLVIDEVSLDGQPRENAAVRVLVKVTNKGDAPAYAIPVYLQLDGKSVGNRVERGRFNPGQTFELGVPWVPAQPGTQTLKVVLDPERIVKEANTSNNVSSLDLDVLGKPGVNLQVVRLDPPGRVAVGKEADFHAWVVNSGEIPAFSCTVTLKEGGLAVATGRSSYPLEPGREVLVKLKWTPTLPGTATLTAEVESGGPGRETTMEDNRSEVQVEVIDPAAPKAAR